MTLDRLGPYRADPAHGALPHRAPSTRCTAESMHHVWYRYRACYTADGKHALLAGRKGHLAILDWQEHTIVRELQVRHRVGVEQRELQVRHREGVEQRELQRRGTPPGRLPHTSFFSCTVACGPHTGARDGARRLLLTLTLTLTGARDGARRLLLPRPHHVRRGAAPAPVHLRRAGHRAALPAQPPAAGQKENRI